jgi:hypothetical protein
MLPLLHLARPTAFIGVNVPVVAFQFDPVATAESSTVALIGIDVITLVIRLALSKSGCNAEYVAS